MARRPPTSISSSSGLTSEMSKLRTNILVSVVGMTPQVVTETLYALIVERGLKVSEVYVVTTDEGKKTIAGEKGLPPLADEIAKLAETYNVEVPAFPIDTNCITVEDETIQVGDIDSSKKSLIFFNTVTEFIRALSADPDSAIRCSIAGGRKTMGLAAGYAMSLFGRPQDTLSHVLASKELETSRKFFPEPHHNAEHVVLVDIPFIRLRNLVSDIDLFAGGYSDFVTATQNVVDVKTGTFGERFGIIGDSPQMLNVYEKIRDYSGENEPVLIVGETGTGKKLVAKALHEQSPRATRPFITVNCGTFGDVTMARSELFGHKRGSFTGAVADHRGAFLLADNGTLFLDEVNSLPLQVQAGLLRAIDEHFIQPVGDKDASVDVRIIAASNSKDFAADVNQGKFRDDLFYRLNVLTIDIRPLRERRQDIISTFNFLLAKKIGESRKPIRQVDKRLIALLGAYDYPGNVRELDSIVSRLVADCRSGILTIDLLSNDVAEKARTTLGVPSGLLESEELISLDDLERRYLLKILQKTTGNKLQAAKILGITDDTVRAKIRKYGIHDQEYLDSR